MFWTAIFCRAVDLLQIVSSAAFYFGRFVISQKRMRAFSATSFVERDIPQKSHQLIFCIGWCASLLASISMWPILSPPVFLLDCRNGRTNCCSGMHLNSVESSLSRCFLRRFGCLISEWLIGICNTKTKNRVFFKKKLKDISPFCGSTDTPVLVFWWRLPWVSKPGLIPFACFLTYVILRFTSSVTPADC